MGKKIVIVGGVAGGASVAARYRRLDEESEIIMLEKGGYVSFANCGLPYYVGNAIKERENLELMTPEEFLSRFNIDVRIKNEAISINKNNKTIEVKNLENNEIYNLTYDYLVLAPGAKPIKPPFKGMEEIPLFTLRTIPDSVEIEEFISKNEPESAVVIGGGFIGLEMAENLAERGLYVTIVEMLDQTMMPLDKEMAQMIHEELLLNGVDLVLNDAVKEFSKSSSNKSLVITQSGKEIETDMVVLSIGVRPDTAFIKSSEIEMDNKGHIVVNDRFQTSDPIIYAVGDAVTLKNYVTGVRTNIYLAGPANQGGRIIANNIAGINTSYKGILGASVVKAFDLVIAQVGINEKILKRTDIDYEKIYVHPNNHAGYYPGAQGLNIKLIFEKPNGKILGVQIIGGTGTEKRVDVISTVMQYGGTVFDLEQLQLTYAPPFSSAKDPVNMAGYVASNVLRGDHMIFHWSDIDSIKKSGGTLYDVRTKEEYEIGHIPGAINISDLEFRDHLEEIPHNKDAPIYVYCQVGFRGYLVYRLLTNLGYTNVRNLTGGYTTYRYAISTIENFRELVGDLHAIVDQKRKETERIESKNVIRVDACGLACPGPVNALIKGVKKAPVDSEIEIIASDPTFNASVRAWTDITDGVELLSLGKREGNIVARIKKNIADLNILVDESPEHDDLDKDKKQKKEKKGRIKPAGEPAVTNITPEELYERCCTDEGPALLVDVRPEMEIKQSGGKLEEAKIIPLAKLMQEPTQLSEYKDKEVVFICLSGSRSTMAAQILARQGFKDVRSLYGGMMFWLRKGYPLKKDEIKH